MRTSLQNLYEGAISSVLGRCCGWNVPRLPEWHRTTWNNGRSSTQFCDRRTSHSKCSRIPQLPLDVCRRALRPPDPANNKRMVGMVGGPESAVCNAEKEGAIPRSSL